MAVLGRISGGRAGLAESALLPDAKVRKKVTSKIYISICTCDNKKGRNSLRIGQRTVRHDRGRGNLSGASRASITGARFVRKEMAGPQLRLLPRPARSHEPLARSRSRSMRTAARRNSASDAVIDAAFGADFAASERSRSLAGNPVAFIHHKVCPGHTHVAWFAPPSACYMNRRSTGTIPALRYIPCSRQSLRSASPPRSPSCLSRLPPSRAHPSLTAASGGGLKFPPSR